MKRLYKSEDECARKISEFSAARYEVALQVTLCTLDALTETVNFQSDAQLQDHSFHSYHKLQKGTV